MIIFLKAQGSAILATAVDFLTTTLFVELFFIQKFPAGVIGLFVGGCCNFLVNKNWVFTKRKGSNTFYSVMKYILVWAGNFFLNTAGYHMMLEKFPTWHYLLSKMIVAIIVGIFYNYFLQKKFVFK